MKWCGRPELNRHGVSPDGFSYPLRLSPPPLPSVCGLDYPFAVAVEALGAARLVSTPSRFTGLGSGLPLKVSPSLSSSTSQVSLERTQIFSLSPLRLPIPPRPHCAALYRALASCLQGASAGGLALIAPILFRVWRAFRVNRRRAERRADVRGVILLDRFNTGPAVLRYPTPRFPRTLISRMRSLVSSSRTISISRFSIRAVTDLAVPLVGRHVRQCWHPALADSHLQYLAQRHGLSFLSSASATAISLRKVVRIGRGDRYSYSWR
jgi:hypothetical protein